MLVNVGIPVLYIVVLLCVMVMCSRTRYTDRWEDYITVLPPEGPSEPSGQVEEET